MRSAFNIYPALFRLTLKQEQSIERGSHATQSAREFNYKKEKYFTPSPYTYRGECIFNESRTEITMVINGTKGSPLAQEFFNARSNGLQPAEFKGERYMITYIPVLN